MYLCKCYLKIKNRKKKKCGFSFIHFGKGYSRNQGNMWMKDLPQWQKMKESNQVTTYIYTCDMFDIHIYA